MRVLIEMGHPAHFHFFRGAISLLRQEGHELTIVTRNKEITNDLLDRAGLAYRCLSKPAIGGIALFAELLGRWHQVHKIIREEGIEVAASISGISTSLPAKMRGIRNVLFTDTEDARLSNRIAFPFADAIYTPRFYQGGLGPKHRRYFGLHELAYLRDFDLAQGAEARMGLGLPQNYSVIRVVANDALHDAGLRGLTRETLRDAIRTLRAYGEVLISAQGPLPEEFLPLRIQTPIEKIHAVLAGARLFLGDSPTMAVESSLLGTPAFLISERAQSLGNMVGLEREFQLLRNFKSWEEAKGELPSSSGMAEYRQAWARRASDFRAQTTDVRRLIVDAILCVE